VFSYSEIILSLIFETRFVKLLSEPSLSYQRCTSPHRMAAHFPRIFKRKKSQIMRPRPGQSPVPVILGKADTFSRLVNDGSAYSPLSAEKFFASALLRLRNVSVGPA
jgi:hypothetical protein